MSTKKGHHFASVTEFKTRFAKMPTDWIERRLRDYPTIKEAAIACREILEERRTTGADPHSNICEDATPTI